MKLFYVLGLVAALAEARNVVDLNLKWSGEDLRKRDAKNVADLDLDLAAFARGHIENKKNVINIPKERRSEDEWKMEQLVLPKDSEQEFTILPEENIALTTALSQIPEISIFAQYFRDNVHLLKVYSAMSAEEKAPEQMLIFAPSDSAIQALDAKPWSWPTQVTEQNNAKDEVTNANIQHFVESHVVMTDSLSSFGAGGVTFQSLNGNTIQFKLDKDSFKVSLPDVEEWTPVTKIQMMKNGALIIIDKTLDWPGRAK